MTWTKYVDAHTSKETSHTKIRLVPLIVAETITFPQNISDRQTEGQKDICNYRAVSQLKKSI